MESIKCRVCNKISKFVFKTKIMNKHEISYYLCDTCEFLQVEEPYWLDEAYASPINLTDTGIISRNILYSQTISVLLYNFFDTNVKYLDFAGGYGIFSRLMRDIGFDFLWHDIYTKNIVARGFEYTEDMGRVEALTAFETFEHFVNPIPEMENMLKISDTIIFSTMMRPELIPNPDEWWYYGREHGQHTALYRVKTLEYIADKFNLKLYTNGGDLHLFTKKSFLPKVISSKFLDEIQKVLKPRDAALFKQAYNKSFRMFNSELGIVENVKLMQQRLNLEDYLFLDPDITEKKREALTALLEFKDLTQRCVIDTFVHAPEIFELIVKKDLQSKTFDDMILMKKYIH